jgi:predicted nucleic acid-binding protein
VSGFLVDTNVLSDLRKRRPNPGVLEWFDETDEELLHLSVITLGEIKRGTERLRLRDPTQAVSLDAWMESLQLRFADRLHPIDEAVAMRWGELGIHQPISVTDGLIAATALYHGLTVVTRNTSDFVPNHIPVFNPFRGDSNASH